MGTAGNGSRNARLLADFRGPGCGNEDRGEGSEPGERRQRRNGNGKLCAVIDHCRNIGGHRFGGTDVSGLAQSRTIPRHLGFHRKCECQQAQGAGEQPPAKYRNRG